MALIYVADDDPYICHMLRRQLESDGHEVNTFEDGVNLLEAFLHEACDLIITDVMMPAMDGYTLCSRLRKISQVPIIMLSAKGEEMDRIQGLELGSDDYMAKPFSLKELSLKVRNMLGRNMTMHDKTAQDEDVGLPRCKDLTVDPKGHQVLVGERPLNLSDKEFRFMNILIEGKNKAFSREELTNLLWGYDYVEDTRMLDHLVKRLRKKLIENEVLCEVETVWGFGYKVSEP